MNRQKKTLMILLALLLLAIGYAYLSMPDQQRVAPEVRPESGVTTTGKKRPMDKKQLRVDLLEKAPTRYKGADRDIFNYAKVKTAPAPKPKPTPPPVVKPVQPPPVVNQVVRQQLARFTFLGFLVKDGERTVFLSRGEELFLVQEGAQFGDDNQFKALTISPETMSISQAGDSRTIDIQLVEKEPLIPTQNETEVLRPTAPITTPTPTVQHRWPRIPASGVNR
jgi:hypothetical protein